MNLEIAKRQRDIKKFEKINYHKNYIIEKLKSEVENNLKTIKRYNIEIQYFKTEILKIRKWIRK